MEAELLTQFKNIALVDCERLKTSFVKNEPNAKKYTLADTTEDKDHRMDYRIEMITKEDRDKVLGFLRKFFFRDEPLNQSVGLIPEGENSTCVELEKYSMDALQEDLSLMAVSTGGSVVGVTLNGTMNPSSEEEPEYIVNCRNSKFKLILKLLYTVDRKADIRNKFFDHKVMEIRIISVDTNWRGKGVAKALFDRSIELAKSRGFDTIRVDCTSAITGKLCRRFGFEQIFQLKYDDHVDEQGNPIFKPQPPHEAVVTYVKKLWE